MFIVLLKFSDNRDEAGLFMDGHKAWLQQGFDDDVFLLEGTLQPGIGGGILANATTPEALRERINQDPFVAQNVVTAEILELQPSRADERLEFLLSQNVR